MYSFIELNKARMHMWVDQISRNLETIERNINHKNYYAIIPQLREQYRILKILRKTMDGKTRLEGWKTTSKVNQNEIINK